MSKERPPKARLDADKTAKPLTRLVGHIRPLQRVGPGLVKADAIEVVATGKRTQLAKNPYTIEPGRQIHKNGKPFLSIRREGDTSNSLADTMTRFIVDLFNSNY